VANALQGNETTNRSSTDPHVNDIPATDGRLQEPVNTDDNNSVLLEDSDHVETEDNVLVEGLEATSTNVKPRAREASNTHSRVPTTPNKRRKVSGDVIELFTFSAVKDIPDSLIHPRKLSKLVV
jgi:hypothetical protein